LKRVTRLLATVILREHLSDEHPDDDHGVVDSIAKLMTDFIADGEDFGFW
jgi:hypothetical protein